MVSKPSEVSLLGSGRKSGTPGSSGEAFTPCWEAFSICMSWATLGPSQVP